MAGRFQEILSSLASKFPQGGGGPLPKLLGVAGLGATGLAYGGGNMLFNVEGGHRAVMYHRFGGVQERVRGEGTHIMVPWFQRPIIYDVRARPRIIQAPREVAPLSLDLSSHVSHADAPVRLALRRAIAAAASSGGAARVDAAMREAASLLALKNEGDWEAFGAAMDTMITSAQDVIEKALL